MTFSWTPGQHVQLDIDTKTTAQREEPERRRRAYEGVVKLNEERRAHGEIVVPPPRPIDLSGLRVGIGGKQAEGGMMAIPVETRCTEIQGTSLRGTFRLGHD